jgi:anhydro-N-acetylmuramic acid kinase
MTLYVGLMSGTSLDGMDGVLVDFDAVPLAVRGWQHRPYPAALREELLALNTSGADELHRAALAANRIAELSAEVTRALLDEASLDASQVRAIGSHGQTVRHRPQQFGGTGYTLQLNNGALLAERTGIDVVCDFRSRDVAAGGQGAPLVPAFHAEIFGDRIESRAVLNLGGIGNLTLLGVDGSVSGFDCGPANALLDAWCARHTGKPYDDAGRWAASGSLVEPLLATLLAEPYFSAPPPKSTGRDLFNPAWLDARLPAGLAPVDVQATLAELTARAAADHLRRHAPHATRLLVCGGGAYNTHVLQRLSALLPGVAVETTARYGIEPTQVEAVAFAWLARAFVEQQPGNRVQVTGAAGPRILGALYPR